MDERIKNTIVNILDDKGNALGTGFFFEEKHILTCFHVVKSCNEKIKYRFDNGNCYEAQIIITDAVRDFAICKTDKANEFLEISSSVKGLDDKEKYETYGFCESTGSTLVVPNITYRNDTKKKTKDGIELNIHILGDSNDIYFGHSGAPLLNKNGKVVGIIEGIFLTEDDRLSKISYSLRNRELIDFLSDFFYELTEFKKVMNNYKKNKTTYDGIVKRIKEQNPTIFIGNSITEFANGGKIALIDYVFNKLYVREDNEDKKKIFQNSELGLSLENFPNDFIKFRMEEVLADYLNVDINNAKFELQTGIFVSCFNLCIRIMPDSFWNYVIERFNRANKFLYSKSKISEIIEDVLYVYTLSLEEANGKIIYEFNKIKGLNENFLKEWTKNRSIFFIDIDFCENEFDLASSLFPSTINYAVVPVDISNIDELEKYESRFIDISIMAIFYNKNRPNERSAVMHKLLVDTGNKIFESIYNKLDFRYSEHKLVGRKNELLWLYSFLNCSDKFIWTIVYGDIDCGKSRVVFDFMKKNQVDWDCYFVHYAETRQFFSDYKKGMSKEFKNRSKSNIFIVFDDFDLVENKTEIFKSLFTYISSTQYKLRVIFICSTDNELFEDDPNNEIVNKAALKAKYSKSLKINALNKDDLISVCCNYAEYLQVLANKTDEELSYILKSIRTVIGNIYEKYFGKDPILMNNCLAKTLELLGLLPIGMTYTDYSLYCLNHPSKLDGDYNILDEQTKYSQVLQSRDIYKDYDKYVKIISNQLGDFFWTDTDIER